MESDELCQMMFTLILLCGPCQKRTSPSRSSHSFRFASSNLLHRWARLLKVIAWSCSNYLHYVLSLYEESPLLVEILIWHVASACKQLKCGSKLYRASWIVQWFVVVSGRSISQALTELSFSLLARVYSTQRRVRVKGTRTGLVRKKTSIFNQSKHEKKNYFKWLTSMSDRVAQIEFLISFLQTSRPRIVAPLQS